MERLTRDSIFHYVKEKYQTEPEYLWAKFPDYAVNGQKINGTVS